LSAAQAIGGLFLQISLYQTVDVQLRSTAIALMRSLCYG
jgi:hypothetical protein